MRIRSRMVDSFAFLNRRRGGGVRRGMRLCLSHWLSGGAARLNLLQGASPGFGDAELDEQDTQDTDPAENREHRILRHTCRHDGEEQADEEGSDPVEGRSQAGGLATDG